MSEKFTVKEIDQLREFCESKVLFGIYNPKGHFFKRSASYNPDKLIPQVEHMVRTFLEAGIHPEDFPDDYKKEEWPE